MDPKPRRNIRFPVWLGIALILAGLLLAGWALYKLQQDLRSRDWPITEGFLVRSEEVPGRKYRYRAVVSYSYKVNGIKYWSEKIGPGAQDPRQYVRKHPSGTWVDVYYNPVHPETAVLVPGPDTFLTTLEISGGLLWVATGVYGLRSTLKKRPGSSVRP